MILMTGASGRTTSIIIREFIKQRTKVRALVRERRTATEFDSSPYVELVEGRIGDPSTLTSALKGIGDVLLISSPRGAMMRDQCSFIDTAKATGIRRIVKFSGRETGLHFVSENFSGTRDHERIEHYLEESGLAWTHLRPSQFMQTYLDELPSIKTNQKLIRPMGDARVSPVDIRDVAKVAYRVLTENGHEGIRYELTGPEALTMAEAAEVISKATSQHIPYWDVSPTEHSRFMREEGAPLPVVELLAQLYAERRKSRFSSVSLEPYKKFGLVPASFDEFAREHADQWRSEMRR